MHWVPLGYCRVYLVNTRGNISNFVDVLDITKKKLNSQGNGVNLMPYYWNAQGVTQTLGKNHRNYYHFRLSALLFYLSYDSPFSANFTEPVKNVDLAYLADAKLGRTAERVSRMPRL